MSGHNSSLAFGARLEAAESRIAAERVMLWAIAGQVSRAAQEISVLKRLNSSQGDAGQQEQPEGMGKSPAGREAAG